MQDAAQMLCKVSKPFSSCISEQEHDKTSTHSISSSVHSLWKRIKV